MIKITEQIKEQIRILYVVEGLSAGEISRQLKTSVTTITKYLKEMGVEIVKRQSYKKFNIQEIIELYKEGIPIYKIAELHKSSQETISKKLKENGIVVNHSGVAKFNEKIFDNIDNEEKAYWLGFIFADGYIAKLNPHKKLNYAFSIGLKSSDIKHLEKFNLFMEHKKYNIRIHETIREDKLYKVCRWDISNKHL